MSTTKTEQEKIQAAGGLLWRQCLTGYEIAVVHTKKNPDWSLPKGKLNDGESWQNAAPRAVRKVTGCIPKIIAYAGVISYEKDGNPLFSSFP